MGTPETADLRAARPVLSPGWDEPPVDRPRRRSARWRRLLAGAAGITRFQPGACCGCSSVATCHVCDMPASVHVEGPYEPADYAFIGCFGTTCVWQGLATSPGCTPCPGDCSGETQLNGTQCNCFMAQFSCSGGALPTITIYTCAEVAFGSLGPATSYDCAGHLIQWALATDGSFWEVTW